MQQRTGRWQWVFFGAAAAIAVVVYLLLTLSRNAATEQPIAPPAPFGKANFNEMKTDTFVSLLRGAYGDLITCKIADKNLEVDMKANELTKDFFNGNDALLKFGTGDFGFDIKYNTEARTLHAQFRISEQNGVNVPNDVLIPLIDKTTKTIHVDQQQ